MSTADAKALLAQGGDAARRAIALLDEAHARGDGEASALLAVIAAAGLGRTPDWARALALLHDSAARGHAPARAQLDVVRTFDMAQWRAPPQKQILREAPRIRAIAQFAPPRVCAWVKERAAPLLAAARTFDYSGDQAKASADSGRTNTEMEFSLGETDLVILLLRERMAAATGLRSAAMEPTKVLHYAPGQRFDRHFDFIETNEASGAQRVSEEGQRLATFLLYLNDDYEGGETEFPAVRLAHRGAAGDALYFANVDASGQPDRATLHAGLAPSRGEKWVLSQWIRDRAWVSG